MHRIRHVLAIYSAVKLSDEIQYASRTSDRFQEKALCGLRMQTLCIDHYRTDSVTAGNT